MFRAPTSPGRVFLGFLLAVLPVAAGPLASPKRGLVFTPNPKSPSDNTIWVQEPSDLTWYYNYQEKPSPVFSSIPQSDFEFVPMLWGTPPDPTTDTTFLKAVRELVNEKKINITNVLAFNEPDGPFHYGGSNMDPDVAAQIWVNNIEPLRDMGIRVGLPACTSAPDGLSWMQTFLRSCSKIVSGSGPQKNCTWDFVPLHVYGDFEALASHMGVYAAAFPNETFWITEYNYHNQSLADTQKFYNTSAEYLDRLDFVERYSLFGAFRSHDSNVGPNAAMLSSDGKLTDIGAWYLGRQGTGVLPETGGAYATSPKATMALFVSFLIAAVMLGS